MPLSPPRRWPASLLRPWSLQQRALLVALLSSLPLIAVLVLDAIDHQESRRESLRQHAAAVLQTAAREQAQELIKVRTLLETAERIPDVVGSSTARCMTVLPKLLPVTHPYQTLSRTDTQGRIDCANREAAVGIRVDTLASFQRPRRTNRFDIGDYQRSRVGGIAVIVAALPVRDAQGEFQHMLAVSLRLDSLLAHLNVGTLPPGTLLEMRDQSGRRLVDRVVPGAPAPPMTDTSALPAMLREAPTLQLGPQDFWEHLTPDGTWTLWTRIQTDPARAAAWVVAHVPATYLTGAVREDAWWRLALGFGVMALLSLVAWSAARRWVGQEVEALVRLASLVRDEHPLPETATRLPDLAPVEAQLREVSRIQRERKQMSQQLRQTERLDSLGAVVGSVAHDFHNALGVMLTAAEVAEDDVAPHSSAADQLRLIRQAVERSAQITQQLLAFTRRTPGEAQTAKLKQVLEPMRDVLPRVLGKPHHLVWEIPDEAIWVHLDGVELEQALMNLVSNARAAFAPHQSGTVTIRAHVPRPSAALDVGLDMGTPWCVLEVEDTGSGIPADHLARICEPFFSTKQHEGGTGLGLPSVVGMVRRAGGDLQIESTVGVGSCLRLWLPRITADQLAHQERIRAAAPSQQPLTPVRVWLVEDEPDLRSNLIQRLMSAQYPTSAFDSAEAALAALEDPTTTMPDIIVTDWQMPGAGGAAVVAVAQALEVPCLVLSANPPADLDPQQVVLKPVGSDELRRRIAQHLDRRPRTVGRG